MVLHALAGCGTRLPLVALIAGFSLLPASAARGSHPDNDECPDTEVNGGESLEQFLVDQDGNAIKSGSKLPLMRDGNHPVTRVDVHALAQVYGSCDMYFLHPISQSCELGLHSERVTPKIHGVFDTPYVTGGLSSEWAIDENGDGVSVHVLDSRDDTATTPGPVTKFSNLYIHPGRYTHWSWSPINVTPCHLYPDGIWSTAASFEVVHEDDLKNLGCDKETGVGNPCSALTGNKFEREEDYSGPVLPFVRFYNSQSPIDVGLGIGWMTDYHRRLTPLSDTLVVLRGTGRGEVFRKQPDDSWLGDADTRLVVTEDAGGFTIARRDGWTERYDLTGRLLSETDPSGNATTYAYFPGGALATVTGPYGHTLGFAYDSTGRIDTLTLPGSQTIDFAYTGDNLTTVAYPDLTTRTYHYEDANLPNHLTGITDEKGARFATFAYDIDGRAISTEHATTSNGAPQERFTLLYNSSLWTTVTDPRGNAENWVFSSPNLGVKNLVHRKHLADGLFMDQTFDANNNVLTRLDELGRTTSFAWNATNQMTSRTEAVGTAEERTFTFAYESPTLDLTTLMTRPSVAAGQSAQTQIVYDPVHRRPTSMTESGFRPDGTTVSRSVTLQYNAQGELIQIDGPRTDVSDLTTFSYYACATGAECGQLGSVQNALGHTTTFDSYDAHGRITQTTDPLDTVTTYSYDDRGRLLSLTQTPVSGSPRTWAFTYDDAGQLETSTSPAGVVLTYSYDDAHDLRSIEDADGNRVEYRYDLAGNRISEQLKDDSGTLQHDIQASYDTRNRVSQLVEATSVTDIVFDAVGRLTSQTDPNGHQTIFGYDVLDRLSSVVDALTQAADYDYDASDALSQLIAPNGVVTSYASDDLGNALSEQSPDRGNLAFSHDDAGNVTTFTHQDSGRTVSFSYDELGRVLTRDHAGTSEDVAFSYDTCPNGTGRLCSVTHESGTTSFEYDAFGNVTRRSEVIEGDTYLTDYVYDADDRVSQITYPSGHVVAYPRDAQGRIQAVSLDSGSGPVTLSSARSYRGDGLLLSQTWGNGLVETRGYTGLRLLETYTLGSVEDEAFSYDLAGNLTARSGSTWNLGYQYDEVDRLTTDTGGSGSRTYSYDADGNRRTLDVDGSLIDYGYELGTNRLNDIDGDAVTSDAEGRITETKTHQYTYNEASRLSVVDFKKKKGRRFELQERGRYAYDAFGLRRTKTAGGEVTVYHYDEAGNLLLETDDAGEVQRVTVWADGTPIAQLAVETTTTGRGKKKQTVTTETLTYLHVDHLNTPRWSTDASGALVWRWQSDGFAEALPDEDVDADGTNVVVDLRLPGQLYDAESGLHYNRFRYYDPATGRYLRADPIGILGGSNVYAYASAQPVGAVDPLGLLPIRDLPAIPFDPDPLDILLEVGRNNEECEPRSQADEAQDADDRSEDRLFDFASRSLDNFVLTNKVPGLLAPTFGALLSGISGNAARGTGALTVRQLGTSLLLNRPVSSALITRAALVGTGTAATISFVLTGGSFEVGVVIGSLIATIPVGSDGLTVGTFFGDRAFDAIYGPLNPTPSPSP